MFISRTPESGWVCTHGGDNVLAAATGPPGHERGFPMSRMIKSVVTMLMMVSAAMGIAATSADPAEADTRKKFGCPAGYVCLYTMAGWSEDKPKKKYFTYGAHNFSGQYGEHLVFNNQWGGAKATLNKGYNGRNPDLTVVQEDWEIVNMTPINSITLKP